MTPKTPREKAEEVVSKWSRTESPGVGGDLLVQSIANALHKAILEERKRCSWIARKHATLPPCNDMKGQICGEEIARKIMKEAE